MSQTILSFVLLSLLGMAPALAWGQSASAHGDIVELCAPLSTLVPIPGVLEPGGCVISLSVDIPVDAPEDLGVGAFLCDGHGTWFQQASATPLTPGLRHIDFHLGPRDHLVSEPAGMVWDQTAASVMRSAGIYFWSASSSRAHLHLVELKVHGFGVEAHRSRGTAHHLTNLSASEMPAAVVTTSGSVSAAPATATRGDGLFHARTGARWALSVTPLWAPSNPYDPQEFALNLIIDTPSGEHQHLPGFYIQEMRHQDRGDREQVCACSAGHFEIRYRPRQPGRYTVRLETVVAGSSRVRILPDLEVDGAPWNGYVHIDPQDPRYFRSANAFFWPMGINLRSVNDLRDEQHYHLLPTPERGTYAYESYLRRLGQSGANAVEIWLSSWNLGLEWRADWPGYYGIGRYNQENAWRLDRILDLAYAQGIRVNLVINNHGQASTTNDGEWASNPYNKVLGGPLSKPEEFFSSAAAVAGQERLRRYLVARYADHPAILGWELWSEVNLTAGRGEPLRLWHEHAASRWHELDTYGHPVSSHWSGNYRTPPHDILDLPGLDYLCVDAYHAPTTALADLLNATLHDGNTTRGLAQYNMPILVTEYGCNWDAGPGPQLAAEYASGPWIALVSGHAGAPLLWWFEWADQIKGFAPLRAMSRFLIGEDLHGMEAHTVTLTQQNYDSTLWAHAWIRPGRVLGYLLDNEWGRTGTDQGSHDRVSIIVAASVPAENLQLQWWDADTGTILEQHAIAHRGGALIITAPAFSNHLAFKLLRTANSPATKIADADLSAPQR